MKGAITITCTEVEAERGLKTTTAIEGSLEFNSRTDKYRLMTHLADALELTPEDWINISVYRRLTELGAISSDKHTGSSITIDMIATLKALGQLE